VQKNLDAIREVHGTHIINLSKMKKIELAETLANIAQAHRIQMLACCSDFLLSDKIQKAHCVDGHLIKALFPRKSFQVKLNPTRKECSCSDSRDIGGYDTCPHGCVYCYANKSPKIALQNYRLHRPYSAVLN
jgi:sulfatase maturation enzyme AslB (radical SAM superfamily)